MYLSHWIPRDIGLYFIFLNKCQTIQRNSVRVQFLRQIFVLRDSVYSFWLHHCYPVILKFFWIYYTWDCFTTGIVNGFACLILFNDFLILRNVLLLLCCYCHQKDAVRCLHFQSTPGFTTKLFLSMHHSLRFTFVLVSLLFFYPHSAPLPLNNILLRVRSFIVPKSSSYFAFCHAIFSREFTCIMEHRKNYLLFHIEFYTFTT